MMRKEFKRKLYFLIILIIPLLISSGSAQLSLSKDVSKIHLCSLVKATWWLNYNTTSGEVISIETNNDALVSVGSSLKNDKLGKTYINIVNSKEVKETSVLSMTNKDKMFINLTVLNDFGLITGIETECRYPA